MGNINHGSRKHLTKSIQKPKSDAVFDVEVIPKGGRTVGVYVKGPYEIKLSEMYPNVPLASAVRQFLIDNIKLED